MSRPAGEGVGHASAGLDQPKHGVSPHTGEFLASEGLLWHGDAGFRFAAFLASFHRLGLWLRGRATSSPPLSRPSSFTRWPHDAPHPIPARQVHHRRGAAGSSGRSRRRGDDDRRSRSPSGYTKTRRKRSPRSSGRRSCIEGARSDAELRLTLRSKMKDSALRQMAEDAVEWQAEFNKQLAADTCGHVACRRCGSNAAWTRDGRLWSVACKDCAWSACGAVSAATIAN